MTQVASNMREMKDASVLYCDSLYQVCEEINGTDTELCVKTTVFGI